MKRTMAMMIAAAALTAVLGTQAAAMDWQAPVQAARHAIAKMLNGTFLASPAATADGRIAAVGGVRLFGQDYTLVSIDLAAGRAR